MQQVKSPFASKTNWVNLITTVIGFLALPQINQIVPEKYTPVVLLVSGLLNLILRNFFTAQPTTQFAADQATK